ncbi:restriction endonuclease subunit S [Allocoleopsis franciscana]|uniref:Restriction endonuclease S subunit n=1 Tax=Allocoleopsis franciscana PCC 7113 TaxID=1173027 RepID=K9WHS9_9CYAN|nr:restriction endonuclease subunit S [Allocoleopsis franciscana]AFZ19366.1 restriction endonuclease S subunit [Allocoleopsis franciscana PCC 7113]
MIEDTNSLPKLPEGWIWVTFPELAEAQPHALKAGPFGSALKKEFYVPHGYKIYGQEQVIAENPFYGNYYIDKERYESLKSCAVKSGDILISLVGTIGKVLVLPEGIEPGIINPRLVKLSLEKRLIIVEYSKKYLESSIVRHYFSMLSHGGTMDILNLSILKTLPIPLPPLNEQRRIVAKIEALKARSQRVKEELEAIAPLLDQFRQSVLAAAFRGDLTADWREKNPDVEPASVLLEHIRAERRRRWEEAELEKIKAQGKTPKDDKWKEKYKEPESVDDSHLPELPDKWCWATLDQLLFSLRNGLSKRPEDQPPGIPILRISAVRSMEVNTSDIRFYPIDAAEDISSYLLESGDLLFTRYNGSRSFVGVCGLLPNLTDDLLYPDKLIRGQVVDKLLCLSKYLELACNFGVSRSHIDSHIKTSAGQQGIAGSDLKSTPIPLPPVAEQYKIVQAVNQQFSATQSLAAMADESAKNLQLLDQSILAKAFRGELVPQDPNDEPASVLLERIRAEREKLDTKKKAKGKSEKKSRKAKPEAAEPEQLSLPGFE